MLEAYHSGSWGRYQGPHGQRLSEMLSRILDVPFATLCASGTVAVELALRGLQIGPGDQVILAGYDFSGNFRSIETTGAQPVLVDIDPNTWCLDPQWLSQAISSQTRAIIVSHLHGGLAPMRQIKQIARAQNIHVVEDACQAPGATVGGQPAGSWGDVAAFSFGGSKLLTAGRGGALVTPHEEVHQRIKIYCERGNHAFPLSELQAAVLVPQLDQLPERNRQRTANVQRLHDKLGGILRLQPLAPEPADNDPSFYKVAFLYQQDCMEPKREEFLAAVRAEGVAMDAGFRGFVRRSERRCGRVGDLKHSRQAAGATVLLHHPVLLESSEVMDRVAGAIRKVVSGLAVG